jgi:hypothetical protein
MTNLPMLVGTLVHETINQILLDLRRAQPVAVSTAVEHTIGKLDKCLAESERGDWRDSPSKCTNLFEHYYGDTPSEDDLDRIRDRIVRLLEAFYSSPILDQLRSLPGYGWVTQEALDSFTFDGQKIWVSLDLAVRERDLMYIYDWKTGREREADKTQLAVYAMFATEKLHASLSELTLRDFYLDTGKVVSVELEAKTLEETGSLIRSSIAQMLENLDDPVANKASKDRFPMTDDTEKCRQCPFNTVCFPTPVKVTSSEPAQQLTLSFT